MGTSDAGAKMIIPSVPMQVVQQFNDDGSEITSVSQIMRIVLEMMIFFKINYIILIFLSFQMDYYKNYLVVTTTSSSKTVQFYTPV